MYGKVADLNHLFPDLSFRAGVIIRVSNFFFFFLEVNTEIALGSLLLLLLLLSRVSRVQLCATPEMAAH